MSAITANAPTQYGAPTHADYTRVAGRILHLTEKLTQLVDRWIAQHQAPPGSAEPQLAEAPTPTQSPTSSTPTEPTPTEPAPTSIPSIPVHDGPPRPSNPPTPPAAPAPPVPPAPDLKNLTAVSTILKRATEIVHIIFKLQPPEFDDIDHFPYSDPVALREVFGDEEV